MTLDTLQDRNPGGVMLTLGVAIFWLTVTVAVAVHPLAVAVTVYGPGAVTFFVAPVPPPLQAYVTPEVVDDAVSVTEVLVQLSGPGGLSVRFGGVPDWFTTTVAESLHPDDGSVTTRR